MARKPSQVLSDLMDPLLERAPWDLGVLMFTDLQRSDVDKLAMPLAEKLGIRCMIGMGAQSVIAGGVEYEEDEAAVLWVARLPNTNLQSFHVSQEGLQQCIDEEQSLDELIGVDPADKPSFILLGDPFTVDVVRLIEQFERAYPKRPAVGGLASMAGDPGSNVLVFDGHALHGGACGVALHGGVRLDTIVSQGCRPIGEHCVITAAEDNVIHQLSGKAPLQFVSDLLDACSPQDRQLVQRRGLLVGRVINEYQASFTRGDFLIRNPIAFDRDTGSMALNDIIRTGQTVQFHVRDAASAARDLNALLNAAHIDDAFGGLLFSCTGRGLRLFQQASHDAAAIAKRLSKTPVIGCFSAGEIGPIGHQNFIHQHTACIGFLAPEING